MTRSAHDFGAGFGGGEIGASVSSVDFSSGTTAIVCSSDVVVVISSASVDLDVGLSTAAGDGFGLCRFGMFGTAIAVLVSLRPCCGWVGVAFVGEETVTCAGVAGVETCE